MASQPESSQPKSTLHGEAALLVWGDVDRHTIDDAALNDWWTNEHLPERLSIPGFQRARRYGCFHGRNNTAKYMTLYEVSRLDVLTSEKYMEKLDHPTPMTTKHLPTLAAMRRAACKITYSDLRDELKVCESRVGATMVMFEILLPASRQLARDKVQEVLSKVFKTIVPSNRAVMSISLLERDESATAPGSESQSYINANLKSNLAKDTDPRTSWFTFVEFSSLKRHAVDYINYLHNFIDEEFRSMYGEQVQVNSDTYELICSMSSSNA